MALCAKLGAWVERHERKFRVLLMFTHVKLLASFAKERTCIVLHHLTFRCLMRSLIILLYIVALAVGFFSSTPAAHASNPGPHYIQGPPIKCLDVANGFAAAQRTVFVSSPPGGGVEYQHWIWVSVTKPCTSKNLVTQIKVISAVNITCPGSKSPEPPALVFYGPYGLYPGGGYGNADSTWDIIDSCLVIQNGVPVNSVVPTKITRTIWAQGTLITGNERQDVISNSIDILVWGS